MITFDRFRRVGKTLGGIFSLYAKAAMEKRTISASELDTVFFDVGLTYIIVPQSLSASYYLGWPTYEDWIREGALRLSVRESVATKLKVGDMVLLLGHKKIPHMGENIILWHVFHLGLQHKFWISADIAPVEPGLREKFIELADKYID